MVEWIVKRAQGDRARVGTLTGMVCIVANVALCAAKGAIGVVSGSVSIVADAMNNLSDASSNIVSVLGFKLANKPADPEHPYGHGRYEYLSGLVVAALNQKLGDRIESETLRATAQDSKNDVLATGAVLACAIVSQVTGINLDAWVGLAVGAYIGWSGFELIQDTVSPLLGQAPDPKLVEHIRSKIMSYPGVLGVHDLMVHDYGPGRKFASAHAEMAAEADPLESHDTLDNIEQAFRNEDGMIVTLHYDPIVTDDPKVASMRLRINAMAQQIDSRLSIHDLRCVPGPTHTNVIFDCVRPSDLQMSAEDLKQTLAKQVESEYPKSFAKITIDEDYVGHTHE